MTGMTKDSKMPRGRLFASTLLACALCCGGVARADGLSTLKTFVKEVDSGRGQFTQLVISPDGKKTRKSQGSLEFQRPNRFRFAYSAPTSQLIVGDGQKVWLWDEDLNQVTVRPMSQALGATPAALLSSGGALDKDFVLRNVPVPAGQAAGTEWVEAIPRNKDGQFRSVLVGFKSGALMALEIEDGFGQHSRLTFTQFEPRAALSASRFQFTPPAGADVLNQP